MRVSRIGYLHPGVYASSGSDVLSEIRLGHREITMASDSKLEKSVKRYSDIFGTVLLGMHQDLKAQQQVVDRKLADWEQSAQKRSDDISAAKAAVTAIGDELRSRAISVGEACKRVEHVVEATNVAMTKQLDAIDSASATLFEDIKSLLNEARAESAKRLETIEQMQSLHQSRVDAFAKQTRRILLGTVAIAAALIVLGMFIR